MEPMVTGHNKDSSLRDFARRLNMACDHGNLPPKGYGRQVTLAKLAGVGQKGARKWLEGEAFPRVWRLEQLAKKLGVRSQWLMTGEGGMLAESVESAPTPRSVPVIDSVEATDTLMDLDELDDAIYFLFADELLAERLGTRAFAVLVNGHAMTPDFTHGDHVIVDPDVDVLPGDIVLARIDNQLDAVLRRYQDRGQTQDGSPLSALVPLNPDYPTLEIGPDNPGEIIGPAMEHRRRLRPLLS